VVRLFFAAWPDRETRQRIGALAKALKLPDDGCRPVLADNYHLTLAFVGEVAKSQVDALRVIGATQRGPEATIRFDAYEYWPKAEVVVAAASECPDLLAKLRVELHRDLARYGLSLDPRPFRPHVTIARKVSQAPVLQAMSEFAWTVRAFQLVRSVASSAGSVYTVLDTWPLLDAASNPK
jgi:RNA 2',3'-cyclic 3'-phosphodiesterase